MRRQRERVPRCTAEPGPLPQGEGETAVDRDVPRHRDERGDEAFVRLE